MRRGTASKSKNCNGGRSHEREAHRQDDGATGRAGGRAYVQGLRPREGLPQQEPVGRPLDILPLRLSGTQHVPEPRQVRAFKKKTMTWT